MSWSRVIKSLDIEHLKAVMSHVAVEWSNADGIGLAVATSVITEIAQRVGIDPRDVLTSNQVDSMEVKGML